jgi:predicted short-subunit dehydrogenase-like oxidoreductase (DUF2520 family)
MKSKKKKFSVLSVKNSKSKISKNILSGSDVILICTQDDKIKSAVGKIVKTGISLRGKIAAHTSGTYSSGELLQLKKKGAMIASLHPVQTFRRRFKPDENLFKNIYTAIEGDSPAKKALSRMVKDLGSIPVTMNKEFKTYHHICCVISSAYIVSNLSVIRDIYAKKNGFKKVNFFNIYKPLILQTISNIGSAGFEKSLTGPVIRNDLRTIQRHISELENLNEKEIVDYYRFVGRKSLNIALKKGGINKKLFKKLQNLLKIKN